MTKLIQITAPHFCAGVVVEDGVIVEAAPILKYLLGWNEKPMRDYCRVKGWTWCVAATFRDGVA